MSLRATRVDPDGERETRTRCFGETNAPILNIPQVRPIRRIAAVLSTLLLLQLTLLGGGTLCGMHSVDSGAATEQAHDMCNVPAPGQCASMTACAVTTMPATALAVELYAPQGVSYLPAPSDIDSRLATPPELPPPRA